MSAEGSASSSASSTSDAPPASAVAPMRAKPGKKPGKKAKRPKGLKGPELVLLSAIWPFNFYAELRPYPKAPKYFIRWFDGEEREAQVSPAVMRDIVATTQGGAMAQIGDALDPHYQVRKGETASIANALEHIAVHACDGEEGGIDTSLQIFPKKGGEEPS